MEDNTLVSIGKRIAGYRKLRNLTQSDLGKMLGRSQAVVCGWEKGSDPGLKSLIQLSHALGVTPNDLLGYEPPDGTQKIVMPDESMEPHIRKGDILTVQKTDEPPQDGDTVLVDTPKESGIIRKLFRFGTHVMLLSINPAFTPIGAHNVDIKGKVTDIHRKL